MGKKYCRIQIIVQEFSGFNIFSYQKDNWQILLLNTFHLHQVNFCIFLSQYLVISLTQSYQFFHQNL
jgi:hypothetical protein